MVILFTTALLGLLHIGFFFTMNVRLRKVVSDNSGLSQVVSDSSGLSRQVVPESRSLPR